MCVKLNSLFDRETKVFYVTQVFKVVLLILSFMYNSLSYY